MTNAPRLLVKVFEAQDTERQLRELEQKYEQPVAPKESGPWRGPSVGR
jgi:hypothetical protein